ncbi:DNA (cytosine-5-)-methyltransferase [Actinoplanes sp. LDG1-06]|uniref:Cytosine-specific methyltransferase n=1 Tax=Paractinoplanes ovalisporus TaxID=2810368 RepID=A0ABS2AKN4_9ACTN|nr:DNA (cytosine-5-)-methyltransferase [Actinoplanes ovalisporus]MBM2620414.1 DNA (cytosine-5-)-methyltransferase [Actinoplanes ovalisporus]
MNVLELFAGIGGLSLGLQRAGMAIVGHVEIDPFCRQVLHKHWPEVPCHDDVRTAPTWWRAEVRPQVDVVAGGFPCQPFSDAGRRRGLADERWGWPWMADVIRAVRPRYVLVENVPGLVRDAAAFGWVLGDLADLGFDARWSLLSACAMGAPHTRKRLFLLAHPAGQRRRQRGWLERQEESAAQRYLHHWQAQPEPHRVADGVPRRMDRNRTLGNAAIPAIAEHLGHLILDHAVGR